MTTRQQLQRIAQMEPWTKNSGAYWQAVETCNAWIVTGLVVEVCKRRRWALYLMPNGAEIFNGDYSTRIHGASSGALMEAYDLWATAGTAESPPAESRPAGGAEPISRIRMHNVTDGGRQRMP